jgi:uncharacterized repeat protein (TIGR03803 family)
MFRAHRGVALFLAMASLSAPAAAADPAALQYQVLDSFPVATGVNPLSLLKGSDGSFYGLAGHSAVFLQDGAFYRMTAQGRVKELAVFYNQGASLLEPVGTAIQASDGNFYWVMGGGGNNGSGGVRGMTPSGGFVMQVDFPEGTTPAGSLFQASDGKLYGLSERGGYENCGFIYQVTLAGQYARLADFDCLRAGRFPQDGLVPGRTDTELIGVTKEGGAEGSGTIFRFLLGENDLGGLYTFTRASDGGNPLGAPVRAADGNFYGTCSTSGPGGYGTVWKLDLSLSVTVLHAFSGSVGSTSSASPVSRLTIGSDGNFYGAAAFNGDPQKFGYGAIFKVAPSGTTKTLVTFTGPNGRAPSSPPIEGSPGVFFGVTPWGGSSDEGVAYRFK